MIKIDKKAISEAECELILQATYDDPSPLDLPTVKIRVEDFQPMGNIITRLFMQTCTRGRVRNYIHGQLKSIVAEDPWLSQDITPRFIEEFSDRTVEKVVNYVERALTEPHLSVGGISYSCHVPPCAIIVTHMNDNIAKSLLAPALRINDAERLPGYNSQWHSFILWHEIAHGLGRSEYHADKTAALISRCVFQDTNFLKALADIRAVAPALLYKKEGEIEHGFNLCLAIDSVLSLEEQPDLSNIKEVVLPDHRIESKTLDSTVRDIGAKLEKKEPLAFKNRNLSELANCAAAIANTASHEEERMVAQRLAIAAHRLSIGTPAYITVVPKFEI